MQIISHRNFTLVAHDDSEGETRVANYNKPIHVVHRNQFPQHVPDEYAADPHLEMMRNDGHVFTFEPAPAPVPVQPTQEEIRVAIEAAVELLAQLDAPVESSEVEPVAVEDQASDDEPTQDTQPKKEWVGKRRK